ncbi:single-stranded DNA-binding protein [Thermostaphylospora chromogena]|mgnify:CR=1 FL=1|uniref:Single-strand DNA-binding protein n=1 Tax=Thermostaphylospora chromogena TaxID=35622 RepID=A0A1H1HLV8_9ACTN|nr:single-stranded DNA-binding protein [Thermostaphylospora chromogena]SDR26495.1 single-strand DNA-binding protein [Thermostaphylospora chromogena]
MDVNEITLVGRMSAPAEVMPLPSGDSRTTWRVIVRAEREGRRPRFDVIDCVTFDPGIAAAVAGWRADDVVGVFGALRRRFFTGRHGKASHVEVEARSVRLIERRGTPPSREKGPSPARRIRTLGDEPANPGVERGR